MPALHMVLAVSIAVIWGTNFVVIKWGLAGFPPFLFGALRFALSSLPLLVFVPRPQLPWSRMIAFGLVQGAGQFGLLFYAMRSDITPGLTALVLQAQVFFTVIVSAVWFREPIRRLQCAALVVGASALCLIAWRGAASGDSSVTTLGLVLTIGAGAGWTAANFIGRAAGRVNMLQFMVWSSIFAAAPLFILSLTFEGYARDVNAMATATSTAWMALAWQAVGNTLFGYGCWNWLLVRHPASAVAPMALLIPVIGMASSAVLTGESVPGWKIAAGSLVIVSLAMNLIASRSAMQSKADTE
jgi:O-acetylserine/cysteine efflux transporter